MKPQKDAKRAEAYYPQSDAGYYVENSGLHCEWGGKARLMLGLAGPPTFEQFRNLVHGLDPHTAEQLTARLLNGRLCGWDVTASNPKGVTLALEGGDERIHAAMWAAVREAMAMLEAYAATRVRKDGKQQDRVTGNLVWYAVEHAETRPTVDPRYPAGHRWHDMPLPDRHVHCFIPNVTFDEEEQRWKAVKFRPIMDIRKYFDRCYDSILARKLTDLGYEVETFWNEKGKYYSWDITGVPDPLKKKNSRRSEEIGELETTIAAERKEAARLAGVAGWEALPDGLSAVEADKLGGTSRREKRDDLTLGECREYWATLPSEDEARQLAETIERAKLGLNPKLDHQAAADAAIDFALRHHSEQQSAFRWEELAATALEHAIGSATPADVEAAAKRAGLLFVERDGMRMATTHELQAEEDYLIALGRPGRGVVPVGVPDDLRRGTLNDGQWQAVRGLLESPSRVNLIEGPAGAGKSTLLSAYDRAMRAADQGVTYLATTAKAVEVLREGGFQAHTLARFLVDEKMQAAAKGGRVVIDETSMLGHKDAVRLFRLAEKLDLTGVLQVVRYDR